VHPTPFKHALAVSGCLALAAFTIPAAAADPDLKPGFPVQLPHFGGTYKGGPGVHTLIGNIDGDANLEILGSSGASNPIYAIKADGSFVPGWPIDNAYGMGYLGLGRLSANAAADQVVAGFWGAVEFAYGGDGTVLPGWPRVADNFISSPPALADIDGDGIDEIFIGEEDLRIHAYRADGSVLPGWPSAYSRVGAQSIFTPAIADLDGDGVPEVIAATGWSTGGVGILAHHADGTLVAGFPVRLEQGYVTTYIAVGDVDGDGAPEIVVVAKDPVFPFAPVLNIIGADGAIKRVIRLTSSFDYGTAPALADLDGDRIPEIVIQGEGTVEVWRGDGTPFPGWPRGTGGSSGDSAPVIGDVDGDGQPDIVVMASFGSNALDSKVFVFDRVGNLHPHFPKAIPAGSGATPAIADLDRDGRNDIIISGNPWNGTADFYDTVWVYDLGGGPHGAIQWGQFAGGPKHQGRYVSPVSAPAPLADLSLQVATSPANPVVGGSLTFNLTVTNRGPATAARARLSHVMQTDMWFVSASAGCALRDTTVICELGDLAPGAAAEVQVTAAPQGSGPRVTRTIVLSEATDPALADNDIRTDLNIGLPVADLGVTQTDSSDPIRAGQSLTYRIVVTNHGPEAASRITLTDKLGDALFVSASAGCSYDNASTVTCNIGSLSAGASRDASVTVVPRFRRTTLANTVTASGPVNDANSANNSATELTAVK
jgi:uncharacterized repeat protein (TIGR01451 family)